MTKFYDATKELTPFEKKADGSSHANSHPRSRSGATAKRNAKRAARAAVKVEVVPQKKGTKKK